MENKTSETVASKKSTNRIVSIDRFRGIVVTLMVVANLLESVEWMPSWATHAATQDALGTFTYVDLIAPAFFFVIGLTLPLSFSHRSEKYGLKKANRHLLIRGLALIGIGTLLAGAVSSIFVEYIYWETLNTIGLAIFCIVPFIKMKFHWKIVFAIVFGFMNDALFLLFQADSEALEFLLGSFLGVFGYVSMLLLTLSFSELFFSRKDVRINKPYLFLALGLICLGIVMELIVPFMRSPYTFSFISIAIGIVALIFQLVHLLSNRYNFSEGIFCIWGKNPLIIYLIHFALLAPFYIPENPKWFVQAHPLLVAFQTLCYWGILNMVAILLNRKNKVIRI